MALSQRQKVLQKREEILLLLQSNPNLTLSSIPSHLLLRSIQPEMRRTELDCFHLLADPILLPHISKKKRKKKKFHPQQLPKYCLSNSINQLDNMQNHCKIKANKHIVKICLWPPLCFQSKWMDENLFEWRFFRVGWRGVGIGGE